jgi:hypothetical protein
MGVGGVDTPVMALFPRVPGVSRVPRRGVPAAALAAAWVVLVVGA